MTAAAGLSNCLNHQHYNPDDGSCRALKLPESSRFYPDDGICRALQLAEVAYIECDYVRCLTVEQLLAIFLLFMQ